MICAIVVMLAAESGTLANPDLVELSGFAVSRADPSLLWGHNDTGSGPYLYRIGLNGEDLGRVTIAKAHTSDWEDIAAFRDRSGPALLIADTGDNFQWRSNSTLYAVRDPGRGNEATLLWRLDFEYPDGAHDVEAVAVDQPAREILLLSKRDRPARLYRLPLPDRQPATKMVAQFVGAIAPPPPISLHERLTTPLSSSFLHNPTAFDISPDGLTAAIVTLREAFIYRRRPGQPWLELFQAPTTPIPLPDLPQVEAGALTPDGRALYVGSEKRPGHWHRIKLPSR